MNKIERVRIILRTRLKQIAIGLFAFIFLFMQYQILDRIESMDYSIDSLNSSITALDYSLIP